MLCSNLLAKSYFIAKYFLLWQLSQLTYETKTYLCNYETNDSFCNITFVEETCAILHNVLVLTSNKFMCCKWCLILQLWKWKNWEISTAEFFDEVGSIIAQSVVDGLGYRNIGGIFKRSLMKTTSCNLCILWASFRYQVLSCHQKVSGRSLETISNLGSG